MMRGGGIEEGGPLHFMHLYRLGLARQPEPEDGQAWLRRRPGGTGAASLVSVQSASDPETRPRDINITLTETETWPEKQWWLEPGEKLTK